MLILRAYTEGYFFLESGCVGFKRMFKDLGLSKILKHPIKSYTS